MSQPDTRTRIARWTWKKTVVGVLLVALVLWMSLANLESVPPLWWDEGWTLSVARNWVELGHYGQLLNGQPRSAGLSAAFPVVAPIALSFRLLGVGVWQGRLVGVLFTFVALSIIFYLAHTLYNRTVALGTLVLLLGMPVVKELHPILVGRQVLGEMPMLAYLLAGYMFLLFALRRKAWWLVPAAIAWGIGLRTKGQTLPFFVLSLVLPLVVALFKRWWQAAGLLVSGLLGAWLVAEWVGWVSRLVQGQAFPDDALPGLFALTALVPVGHVRASALLLALAFGLPTALGLCWAGWREFGWLRQTNCDIGLEITRLALWGLAGSWYAWYLALGMFFPRYLFPPLFIGSLFAAKLFYDWTDGFKVRATVRHASAVMLRWRLSRTTVGALLAVVLVVLTTTSAVLMLVISLPTLADTSVFELARYIDAHTAPDALIETYNSELFFLVHRRYHYPPDQTNVVGLRRLYFNPDEPLDYDPLMADPDYLIVGTPSREWRVYDTVLKTGAFRRLLTLSRYDVYERVR
jgi:4-amino-4-deoxy-L-arabinose transferase-like glycosyltransferase